MIEAAAVWANMHDIVGVALWQIIIIALIVAGFASMIRKG